MLKPEQETQNKRAVWETSATSVGTYMAVCDELNLTVEGDSRVEVQRAAYEAADLLLQDMEEGEREKFAKEKKLLVRKGITLVSPGHGESLHCKYFVLSEFVWEGEEGE